MSDNTVRFTERVETKYGEKVRIESPYEAKDFLNALPFQPGDDYDETRLDSPEDIPDHTFPDDFGAYQSWNAQENCWEVDADAVAELTAYFRAAGFDVENDTSQQTL